MIIKLTQNQVPTAPSFPERSDGGLLLYAGHEVFP